MLKNNKKREIFIWCNELCQHTGEGLLALNFIHDMINIKNVSIFIKTPGCKVYKFKNKKEKNFNFENKSKILKYANVFLGIFYCWIFYFKKKKICYLNYLPLWNFLIFLLLPPKTILGPITGGSMTTKKMGVSWIIRLYLFPIFYKISLVLIYMRNDQILFSTDLLKSYIIKRKNYLYHFNYIFRQIKDIKINKKKIDLLIYNRDYENKHRNLKNIIQTFTKLNKSVHIIGNNIMLKNVFNHGYIKYEKVQNLLNNTKYTINSSENFYSLFIIQAISNKVKIILNSYDKKKIVNFDPKIFLSYKNCKKEINLTDNFSLEDFKKFYKRAEKKTPSDIKIQSYILSFF